MRTVVPESLSLSLLSIFFVTKVIAVRYKQKVEHVKE
jgi:hypothetical protein